MYVLHRWADSYWQAHTRTNIFSARAVLTDDTKFECASGMAEILDGIFEIFLTKIIYRFVPQAIHKKWPRRRLFGMIQCTRGDAAMVLKTLYKRDFYKMSEKFDVSTLYLPMTILRRMIFSRHTIQWLWSRKSNMIVYYVHIRLSVWRRHIWGDDKTSIWFHGFNRQLIRHPCAANKIVVDMDKVGTKWGMTVWMQKRGWTLQSSKAIRLGG